jgi:hypothetical protein
MKLLRINRSIAFSLALLVSAVATPVANAADAGSAGIFTGASGHATKGAVSVVKTSSGLSVVLGSDFVLDGAPDPKVGFGKNGQYDSKSQLAPLGSNTGKQSYAIPASLDISGYNEIYIWCEKYSVPLGVARVR